MKRWKKSVTAYLTKPPVRGYAFKRRLRKSTLDSRRFTRDVAAASFVCVHGGKGLRRYARIPFLGRYLGTFHRSSGEKSGGLREATCQRAGGST
ncbi:hypothetical protein WH47_02087 [Habropoda laboriosa]|uniref:Uncharacterized protein n=1 Tax=Habropoda laboriosa TaxID=597456 RepID=A0A0L7RJA0_9HYME|nr:hypothetical protein WH47_02087 [Habropoda laboriosa]